MGPSRVTIQEKFPNIPPRFVFLWEGIPLCLLGAYCSRIDLKFISPGVLNSLLSMTSPALHHVSPCRTKAILEPLIFLVLVQVTGCWQLCGPTPAICSPICHRFHSLAWEILSEATPAGGFTSAAGLLAPRFPSLRDQAHTHSRESPGEDYLSAWSLCILLSSVTYLPCSSVGMRSKV